MSSAIERFSGVPKIKDKLTFSNRIVNFSSVIPLGGWYGSLGNALLKDKITIFAYHDVSNDPSEFSRAFDLNTDPGVFDYQIGFIKDEFNIISPDDLLKNNLPRKAALITFDDGFYSYFENAIPILKKYNAPSVIFLNMSPIKGSIFWAGLICYLWDKHADFRKFVMNRSQGNAGRKVSFLNCNRKIVSAYLRMINEDIDNKVCEYVGRFAAEKELEKASASSLVYYGSHLFDHDVPLLLSDEELLSSYLRNREELKKYVNYRDILSLPFGQPGTCFARRQIDLLIKAGVKKVFSSSGNVNPVPGPACLDRLSLSTVNDTKTKIWLKVFYQIIKGRITRQGGYRE